MILIGIVILFTALIFWTFTLSQATSQSLYQAKISYEEAVKASNIIQREDNLNKVLSIYSTLEEKYQPIEGNGKLYQHLGNVFLSLEQYPWAILNFYQAKLLRPRDQQIELHLNQALKKLNLPENAPPSIFRKIFFLHYHLSLPERLQLLSLCTLILFGLLSLYIWKHLEFLKGMIAAIVLIWMIFFMSVIYTKYFESLEGVLVNAAMIHRGTNVDSPYVSSKPIMEGMKVEVLDVLNNGQWLKIRTSEGTLGYVDSGSIRLIRL